MTKELEAFEYIKGCALTVKRNERKVLEYVHLSEVIPERFNIIETALKKYDELTSKPVFLCGRTNGHTKALIDYICKNYKEVKITNLEDEKKTKAFEIIKEKIVDIYGIKNSIDVYDYNAGIEYEDNFENRLLTQAEYELLKEILK